MTDTQPDPELAQLRDEALRRTDLVHLIGSSIELKRRGRESVARCPFHTEKTPSFTVVPHKGFFHCFGCGAHGNAIDWLQEYTGLQYRDALAALANQAGLELPKALQGHGSVTTFRRRQEAPPVVIEPEDPAMLEGQVSMAWDILGGCQPGHGTLVEDYLRHRRIELDPVPPTVRFHPRLWLREREFAPAMVLVVQGPDGKIAGCHRTFLQPDGRGHRGKRMAGRCWRGAVRFGPVADALLLGEGFESTASVPVRRTYARWAALSAGNILACRIPNGVRSVLIACDADLARIRPNDGKAVWAGPDAGVAKMRLLQRDGIGARLIHPPLGLDFNDLAMRKTEGWLP